MEEVDQGLIEEVAAPQDQNHEEKPVVEAPKVETPKEDRNWPEMRRQYQELKQLAKAQAEQLEQLRLAQQAKPEVPDEMEGISDEEYIPKGKVKKLLNREIERVRKEVRYEAEKVLQEREKSQFLEKLQRQYSDFNEVVTAETLALLEEQDPELAKSIAETQDPYKIGMQSYKFIKAMNLSEKVSGSRHAKEVDKKLEQNKKTVQSPQAYDKRPMAQAFRMTEAEKSKLYEEMMQYGSMAGSVPELR